MQHTQNLKYLSTDIVTLLHKVEGDFCVSFIPTGL